MQKASTNGNTDRVLLNAEAILNLVVGSQSPDRKDWNADGQVDDPSDGFGLMLNGQNLGYLQAVLCGSGRRSQGARRFPTNGDIR